MAFWSFLEKTGKGMLVAGPSLWQYLPNDCFLTQCYAKHKKAVHQITVNKWNKTVPTSIWERKETNVTTWKWEQNLQSKGWFSLLLTENLWDNTAQSDLWIFFAQEVSRSLFFFKKFWVPCWLKKKKRMEVSVEHGGKLFSTFPADLPFFIYFSILFCRCLEIF